MTSLIIQGHSPLIPLPLLSRLSQREEEIYGKSMEQVFVALTQEMSQATSNYSKQILGITHKPQRTDHTLTCDGQAQQ